MLALLLVKPKIKKVVKKREAKRVLKMEERRVLKTVVKKVVKTETKKEAQILVLSRPFHPSFKNYCRKLPNKLFQAGRNRL